MENKMDGLAQAALIAQQQAAAAAAKKPVNAGGQWYYEGVTIPEAQAKQMLGINQAPQQAAQQQQAAQAQTTAPGLAAGYDKALADYMAYRAKMENMFGPFGK